MSETKTLPCSILRKFEFSVRIAFQAILYLEWHFVVSGKGKDSNKRVEHTLYQRNKAKDEEETWKQMVNA